MVEEQHVTQYGSLLDPRLTPLENLLVHQYVECWLYWSCAQTETDARLRKVWQRLFQQELLHLQLAQRLLEKGEGKQWQQVIPEADFPDPLRLESNIGYVRGVLESTVYNTAVREDYADTRELETLDTFAEYQAQVNDPRKNVVSHGVIRQYIADNGQDYRFETAPHPVEALRCRTRDNTKIGLLPQ